MIDADLVDTVRLHHDGAERGYHGWSHPQALLRLLGEVSGDLSDAVAVEAAILFHDAIYEPRAADNEARSATLAVETLAGRLPAETMARAVRLIEATARHAVPDGLSAPEAADMAMFLDMDLSILAAGEAAFDAYEAGVRHEYREVPEAEFRAGRAGILSGFARRTHLFLSPWGQDRFDAAARANLRRSIARLAHG